jgi:hypothetical protein
MKAEDFDFDVGSKPGLWGSPAVCTGQVWPPKAQYPYL